MPVMIASPGDVSKERNLIRDILHEWNEIHSARTKSVLLPVGWETHAAPVLGEQPQEQINRNVLAECDLLVGVFWTRLGTPTENAESGTAEEIRRHVEAGKPAMIYFSSAPVAPESLDLVQYNKLKEFKAWCRESGLIQEYANPDQFSEKFRRQIQIIIRDDNYLKEKLSIPNSDSKNDMLNIYTQDDVALLKGKSSQFVLTNEAKQLLIEASRDPDGVIMSIRHMGGQSIQTNRIDFVGSTERRLVATWEAALEQLIAYSLIKDRGYKREIFEMTALGYEIADQLIQNRS
jgi:hypothetical protein